MLLRYVYNRFSLILSGGCSGSDYSGCSGGDCGDCGGDKDGAIVILILIAIVVAIFVILGIIFGSILGFLFVNKITKRHLDILQKKSDTKKLVVANLDDPAQMRLVDTEMNYEELISERKQEQEERREVDDDLKKPKGYEI